jgi:hypothetical protein
MNIAALALGRLVAMMSQTLAQGQKRDSCLADCSGTWFRVCATGCGVAGTGRTITVMKQIVSMRVRGGQTVCGASRRVSD